MTHPAASRGPGSALLPGGSGAGVRAASLPMWQLAALFGVLVFCTRFPLVPGQLFSFDDVNFAYALGDFDIRASQPHPPGYPLFVLETRIMDRLRFKRPESNFLALSVAASTAALMLLVRFGARLFGNDSGWWAAWLLLLHPSFWHGGLTSAVRPHLAVISLAVAAACYRVWSGEKRWVLWSAAVLGIAAGVRPETGPVFFPLWAACCLRDRAARRRFPAGLLVLALSIAAWLLPAMLASGGPAEYVRVCLDYLSDQSSMTSPLFGAAAPRWQATLVWLVVWTLSGTLTWPLAALIARRRSLSLPPDTWWFLTLWLAPAFVFAALIHVADPGQTLAIVPGVALVCGYLISRALDVLGAMTPVLQAQTWLAVPVCLGIAVAALPPGIALAAVPVVCAAAAAVLIARSRTPPNPVPRGHAGMFLLVPALVVNTVVFFTPVWYYEGHSRSPVVRALQSVWQHVHSGFAASSLAQIRHAVAIDDRNLRALRDLTASGPAPVVVWHDGDTAWRKINWYAPATSVLVLHREKLDSRSPRVATWRRGPHLLGEFRTAAGVPLDLPAGARVVWFVKPGSPALEQLRVGVRLMSRAGLWYTDLPAAGGEVALGGYMLRWPALAAGRGDNGGH
ncbi:MAG TPA: hypothetical protein VFL57_06415 [Bryobacteraceae bacterium]|nr:hypothetical protein [Bryobacteraceae bacterium]